MRSYFFRQRRGRDDVQLGEENRGPVLKSRFRNERLLFLQRRGRDDVQLVEEVSSAPSFVAIGQVQADL